MFAKVKRAFSLVREAQNSTLSVTEPSSVTDTQRITQEDNVVLPTHTVCAIGVQNRVSNAYNNTNDEEYNSTESGSRSTNDEDPSDTDGTHAVITATPKKKRQYLMKNRRARDNSNEAKKKRKLVDREEIMKVIDADCCKEQCNKRFDFRSIELTREYLSCLNELQKLNFMVSEIRDINGTKLVINGVNVCQTFFVKYYGISNNKYYAAKKSIQTEGNVKYVTNSKTEGTMKEFVISWLTAYLSRVTIDYLPGKNPVRRVPFVEWSDLYKEMVAECALNNAKIPSLDLFRKVRRSNFSDVVRMRATQIGKCSTCLQLKSSIFKCQHKKPKTSEEFRLKEEEMQNLERKYKAHLELCDMERRVYQVTKINAVQCRHEYLSIIIDSSSNVTIPHLSEKPKTWSSLQLLDICITGLLDHTNSYMKLYVCPSKSFAHGANKPMTIVYQHLTYLAAKGPLPPTLRIQLDNCYRENKNRYMLAFLAHLVQLRVFKEIILSFLVVGHTHEDIDQRFSVFSKGLVKKKYRDLIELQEQIKSCYKNNIPETTVINRVIDFSSYYENFSINISGHSKPHVFKFTLENDEVVMIPKKYHSSTHDDPAVHILRGNVVGYPTIIESREFEEKYYKDVRSTFNDDLNDANKSFFNKFVETKGKVYTENVDALQISHDFWNHLIPAPVLAQQPVTRAQEEPVQAETFITVKPSSFIVPTHHTHIKAGNYAFVRVNNRADDLDEKFVVMQVEHIFTNAQNDAYVAGKEWSIKVRAKEKVHIVPSSLEENKFYPFQAVQLVFYKLIGKNNTIIRKNIVDAL